MSTERALRLGVTMRVDSPREYDEPRDGLAQDWAAFLAFALPEAVWVPVPNLGGRVMDYVRDLGLDAFLLTGGNDVGSAEVRDRTESALIAHARVSGAPLLGVCRGLQMLQHAFGGELHRCGASAHVATRHPVVFADGGGTEWEENSYHRFGIRAETLAQGLEPLAATRDGWVEAASAREANLTGIMWHPEREAPFREADRILIRKAFGLR